MKFYLAICLFAISLAAIPYVLHEDGSVTLKQQEIENTQLLVAQMKKQNEDLSQAYDKLRKKYMICKGKTHT